MPHQTQSLPVPLVVLISGSGSNLQAILDRCSDGALAAEVVAVIGNRADALGLERARRSRVPAVYFGYGPFKDLANGRRVYDAALAELVSGYAPAYVVLAGWMRILSMAFLERFPGRVVNLHPAKPGTFPGTHAIERAFDAFQQGKITETGVMVHLVPDEGVDDGPVLAWEAVPILPEDSLADLEQRIHAVEHRLLPATLARLIEQSRI